MHTLRPRLVLEAPTVRTAARLFSTSLEPGAVRGQLSGQMSQSTNLPVVKLEGGRARRLADLTGIYADLSFTIDACTVLMRLLQEKRETDEAWVLKEALWSSALMSYARSFGPAKRYGLSEAVFKDLEADYLAAHRVFIGFRNKHVAHSINPFEQAEIGLMLSEEWAADKKVEGIVAISVRLTNLNEPAAVDLHNLAVTLRNEVGKLAKAEEHEVLRAARAEPVQSFYKLPRLQVRVPHAGNPHDVVRPR